jgi:hypothetical protein
MERNILTAVLAVLLVLCAPAMADWATATVHVGDQPQAVAVNPKKGTLPIFRASVKDGEDSDLIAPVE